MPIWLSQEESHNLLEYLDENGNGEIEINEFDHKISVLINRKLTKETWMISKSVFLTAIADEYDTRFTEETAKIKELFQ